MRRCLFPGAALLLTLGLAGCGVANAAGSSAPAPPKTVTVAQPTSTVPAAASGDGGTSTAAATKSSRTPTYTVTTLTGSRVTIPDGAPTVLYFMSAQCGSCIQGEHQLAQIQAQLPASVHLISLDVTPQYDTAKAVTTVAQSVGAHWPQAFATPVLLQAYHVTELDQVVVISDNGQALFNGGLPSNAKLLQVIDGAVHS